MPKKGTFSIFDLNTLVRIIYLMKSVLMICDLGNIYVLYVVPDRSAASVYTAKNTYGRVVTALTFVAITVP